MSAPLLTTTTSSFVRSVAYASCVRRSCRSLSGCSPVLQQQQQRPHPLRQQFERSPTTDLPVVPRRWPAIFAVVVAGVSGWAAFFFYVTNQEKLSSSVVRQIIRTVQQNHDLHALLGDRIVPEPAWYINGDPRIRGKISTLQGNIDVSFRVRGSKGAGTLYFTSVRKAKGEQFNILRFKVISDDGSVVHLPTH